jgi:hypothetical protein
MKPTEQRSESASFYAAVADLVLVHMQQFRKGLQFHMGGIFSSDTPNIVLDVNGKFCVLLFPI